MRACGYVISVALAMWGAFVAEAATTGLETMESVNASAGLQELGGVCLSIVGLLMLLALRVTNQREEG
jgi:hypothetical protein